MTRVEHASSPGPLVLRSRLTPRNIATEMRRQERDSDFTGYTEHYTFAELEMWLAEVGGRHWQLSQLPIRRIRCWNSRTPLPRLLHVIGEDENGSRHLVGVSEMATAIRHGAQLPGIVVTRSVAKPEQHWILSGYRRLAAHRVAGAKTMLVFHPVGLFGRRQPVPAAMAHR